MTLCSILRAIAIAAVGVCLGVPAHTDEPSSKEHSQSTLAYPRKPVKVIVPFGAGGGTDTFTRIIQAAIEREQLLPEPLVVINVPGAGGSIGSRRVKNARPDGYTILQIHEGMLTNRYAGNTNFGPEAFVPIAGTGAMAHVIAVPEGSPFHDLKSLLEAAKTAPNSIVFAVGIGAPSHFAGMMLEAAYDPATKFRFAQSGGGAKRFASLIGGHSDVSTFSVAEYVEFKQSGLRALALLSEHRDATEPEIPTAKEQGIDVVSANMHFWWAPKGTPQDRITVLAETLRTAMRSPQVRERLQTLATSEDVLTGDELETELKQRESRIAQVSTRDSIQLPNLGIGVLVAAVLTGIVAFLPNRASSISASPADTPPNSVQEESAEPSPETPQTLAVWGLTFATVCYIGLLQLHWLDYRLATFLFVMVAGILLCFQQKRQWPYVLVLAAILSFGLHFIFTEVLVVDLP